MRQLLLHGCVAGCLNHGTWTNWRQQSAHGDLYILLNAAAVWWAAARTLSAERGSTAERRAAFGSKVIYKCVQPHGTVEVRVVGARHNDNVLLWTLCQDLSRLRPQQLLLVRSKMKIFLIYVLTFVEDIKLPLQIRVLHRLKSIRGFKHAHFFSVQAIKAYGGMEVERHSFLTSFVGGVEWVSSASTTDEFVVGWAPQRVDTWRADKWFTCQAHAPYYIVTCCLSSFTIFFSHYLINGTIFG